jgi:hypothetical protein
MYLRNTLQVDTMTLKHLDEVYEDLFLYGLINKETLKKHSQKLRSFLIEKASEKELVNYQEAADYLGTSRQYLGRVLGAINECESHQDNPLLTAIVVKDKNYEKDTHPSLGFFSWPCIPEEHRVHPDSSGSPSEEQLDYWREEWDRVWSAWADK